MTFWRKKLATNEQEISNKILRVCFNESLIFPIPEVIDEDVYSGIGSLKVFRNFSLWPSCSNKLATKYDHSPKLIQQKLADIPENDLLA